MEILEAKNTLRKCGFSTVDIEKLIVLEFSFAKLQLNCNKSARFSINYFINPHLKELIGESLGDILEKRFNELDNGEFKHLVKMTPLNRRYDRYFEELLRFTKIFPNYKAVITERNSL